MTSKFGVGKSVYWIYEAKGEHRIYDDLLVIERISRDELGVHYSLENASEDKIDWCRQEDVFGHLQDAKEACLSRNELAEGKDCDGRCKEV